MKYQQNIKLRIWNGHNFKQPIPEEHRDFLLDTALSVISNKINDDWAEGRFELSLGSDDLFHCSWEVKSEIEF